MRSLWTSPRARRRLFVVGAIALAGGTAALVFLLIPSESGKLASTISIDRGKPVPGERRAPMTPARRAKIDSLLDAFVPAAVARRDPGAAYALASPSMRSGSTRADWRKGNIPVFPYSPRGTTFHGWSVVYSYERRVGLDLSLQPRNPKGSPESYDVEVVRRYGRWLVNSFYPRQTYAPIGGGSTKPTATAPAEHPYNPHQGRLGTAWFLVPLGLLSLIVIVPTVIFTGQWLADRRVARARRGGKRERLPPLPKPPR
jgi:hypothetical protein